MSIESTQHRLGVALVWYLAGVIVFLTLLPFRFSAPNAFSVIGPVTWFDVVTNVILFVPLGFFVGFKGKPSPVVLGFFLSVTVEVAQIWIPTRWPSLADVVANTGGAVLGGWLFSRVTAGLARGRWYFRIPAIELPLVGILYLSVPVVWLGGFASVGDRGRALLAMLVGLAGAAVIGAVDGERPVRIKHRWAGPAIGTGWLALVMLPWWIPDPMIVVAGCTGMFGAVVLLRQVHRWLVRDGARFESVTLQRASIPLGGYLLGLVIWSLDFAGGWRGRFGLSSGVAALDRLELLALMELLGIATLTGYAVAELAGRSPGENRRPIAGASAALMLMLIGSRGFQRGREASLVEAILISLATFIGAILYWRQRAYVRAVSRLPGRNRNRVPDVGSSIISVAKR